MERILFITNDFPPQQGGIQTFIEGLIRQLPKDSVVVHASSQKSEEPQELFDEHISKELGVIVVRDRQKILLPTRALRNRIAGTIHAHSIKTVVFGASVPLGLLAPSLRRLGVTKIVAITHGHEVWWAKMPIFSQLLRRVGASVDHVTYLGAFTRNAISKAFNSDDYGKLTHLPPGVNTTEFHPGEKPRYLIDRFNLEDKKVILCVGRLVQRKGQDALISAMVMIREKFPETHLLIVGSGNDESRLRKLVRKFALNENITFAGRTSEGELPDYFRVADIFASPTRDRFGGLEVEGLGIVYLEASASGIPVIAGQSGGSPDAIHDGETGICVDGRDPHSVAAALMLLLGNRELANQMGKAGRAWMESQWSWEIIGARFRSILELN